ncbi:Meiotic Sister-Chromatid recombination aldehyde dehydrogenase [Coemansia sp. RSA 1813]|nr:Meiotic Sister-Chromatid recombination aldehyde dehydrogenase [Coemansia sp. RSA 1646]KAJ1773932.1 Meiotic Sister-Chromatid recombination aldehyde dehydrogenase [Coemansia sp. RSA 1843]KAJ2214451.1 Meiotic Sister-Chromatid recombination aldehyde dehydrogenase [Coemansia sp. RSA 487]KAJ2569328.1 Meiotic Sister-Chromatid recombination aldehyde dehydrogenase [Coemansia sp. RSA 1813]
MNCISELLAHDALPVAVALVAGSAVLYFMAFYKKSLPAIPFELRPPAESIPGWRGNEVLDTPTIFVKGQPDLIQCFDPATGRSLGQVKTTPIAELDDKIKRARNAQRTWAKTTFEQRRQVLRTLNEFVLSHQREICQVACRDSGKTLVDATLGEVLTTSAKLQWTIKNGETALADDSRDPGFMMMYKRAKVIYQPRGLVAALVSWNYPFHNTIGPVISALFAGNAIVVKASEHVAWSMAYWEQMVKRALNVCGHDPDLVHFVTGFVDVGAAVTSSPLIDHITFIGSPEVGKLVMKSASANLTPVTLELGGKDCAVVFADADMAQCIPVLMRSVIQNASQNCIGIERILVQDKAYGKFVDEMTRRIGAVRVGSILDDEPNTVDCGAMVLANCFDRLESLIEDAVSKGARCLVGGHRFAHPRHPNGQYFEPTLLVDVTPDMDITRNETFGPIMVVMKFTDERDALEKVHSSPYGLGSSVFSGDRSRGRRVALELRTGMANVNDFGVNYICQSLPFGGVGISGFGRFAGPEGLRALCVEKAFTEDRFPLVKTPIPPIVDYPIQDTEKGYQFTQQIVAFAYSDSWWGSVKAGLRLGKLSL